MLRAVLIVFALRLPGWFATMPEVDFETILKTRHSSHCGCA